MTSSLFHPGPAGTDTTAEEANMATPDNVTPLPTTAARGGKKGNKPAAAKKATTTKKAPPAAKKDGTERRKSTISKEGEKVDAFTGEKLPVTAFPTVRQKDGTYVRGDVARKNLAAWREDKRKKREAEKAGEAKAKAAKKATKKATAKKATTKKATAPAAKKATATEKDADA